MKSFGIKNKISKCKLCPVMVRDGGNGFSVIPYNRNMDILHFCCLNHLIFYCKGLEQYLKKKKEAWEDRNEK